MYDIKNWQNFTKKKERRKISQIYPRKTYIVKKTTKFVQKKKKLPQHHIHTKTARNELIISLRLIGGGGDMIIGFFKFILVGIEL